MDRSVRKISSPRVKSRKVTHKFSGTPLLSMVALHYLTTKHKDQCIVIPFKLTPEEHTDISIRWVETDRKLHIPSNFWEEFERHLSHGKSYIVFPFGITYKKGGGHAGFLLYDGVRMELDRFDSAGLTPTLDRIIDSQLKKLMTAHIPLKRYNGPANVLSCMFQEIQESENMKPLRTDPDAGFCSVWACWYVDYRLTNPHETSHQNLCDHAVEQILDEYGSLTKFIRHYSQEIVHHKPVFMKAMYKRFKGKKNVHNMLTTIKLKRIDDRSKHAMSKKRKNKSRLSFRSDL